MPTGTWCTHEKALSVYIHIKSRCAEGKEQCGNEFGASTEANSAALALTMNSMCFEHQGHADTLLVSGRTSGCVVHGA